ncbi:MAG TPA: type VI secretion system-associated protein TagF [Planctomycetota bacterium]
MSSLSPGCYGKLPIHGDFIRHHAGDPEIDEFDQWLQMGILAGRKAAGAGFDAAWDATPPARFLYRSPRTRRVFAGVLAPSVDKAGRRFPFLVFARLDARPEEIEASLVPLLVSGFLDRARDVAFSGWAGKDLKGVQGLIDGLARPLDPAEAKRACSAFVTDTAAPAYWASLFGSPDDPRKYLLAHNLAEILTPKSVPRYALRLPRGAGGEAEVSFWLELARRLHKNPDLPTLTVWGDAPAGAAPGMTLLMDDLREKYFLPVLWPNRDSEFLYPLAGDGATPAAETRTRLARDRYGAILDDPSLRLSTLLLRLGTR